MALGHLESCCPGEPFPFPARGVIPYMHPLQILHHLHHQVVCDRFQDRQQPNHYLQALFGTVLRCLLSRFRGHVFGTLMGTMSAGKDARNIIKLATLTGEGSRSQAPCDIEVPWPLWHRVTNDFHGTHDFISQSKVCQWCTTPFHQMRASPSTLLV